MAPVVSHGLSWLVVMMPHDERPLKRGTAVASTLLPCLSVTRHLFLCSRLSHTAQVMG